ncbi:MAG: radical SAM protein [Deltaproteobacteria bacterium]|nr:MAG: radical SAM protein [Deltaproteobacteria bacterium]
MRRAPVDVIVRGEGEKTLVDVIHAIGAGAPLNEIPGITFRAGQQIVRNPDRSPLSQRELDGQALPLWDRVPEGVYCFFPVELSRGCRYACNFCSIYHKRNRRGYSWPVIRERIDQGIKMLPKFKYKTLMFSDDCFTSDPRTVKQVADYLSTVAPEIEVGIEARANEILHPEVIGSLGKMNVGFLQIGVERGYRDGLQRVGKGIKLSQVIQTTQKLHSLGIAKKVKYSYIIGFPWETLADMKRTIAFAMHLASDLGNMVQINWYMLSPGNEVFRELYGRKLVFLYDFDSWNEHDHSLFFRSHPTLSLEMYNEIREFAGHLERTYPWVSVLGNVFKSSDHPHLATDITIPGPQIPYWTGRWPIFEPSSSALGCLGEKLM